MGRGETIGGIGVSEATSKDRGRIVIGGIRVDGSNTVHYEVEYGAGAGRYFSGAPFFVQYDRQVDVRSVPDGILAIPLLANLLPVAWAIGADVRVARLDRAFHDCLTEVKQAFNLLYPRIGFAGSLHAEQLTDDMPAAPAQRAAAFFSGGVDSLGTFLRRQAEWPYLITIWGGDIGLHQPELWEEVKRHNAAFGRSHGLDSLFIRSGMRTFLNEERIAFRYGRFTRGWWPGIQHGIGMVGLCAPLAYALGIGRLYVPSALPPRLARAVPDGSNTLINNRIRWAGTHVQLEGEEMGRQDKVALIAEYLRGRSADLTVRVCWMNGAYGNCGKCEKCLRTIAGLLAEGIDPCRAGFPYGPETLDAIREQLPGWLSSSKLMAAYWEEVRGRSFAPAEGGVRTREEEAAFFAWLQQLDMAGYGKRGALRRRLLALVPHPLFLYLKRIVQRA